MVIAVVDFESYIPSSRKWSEMADVIFRFKETDASAEGNINEIKANKTILALASDVFKTQFFGSDPAVTVIPVEDANVDAFSIFIDILYNVKVELKDMDLKLLAELFYLAETYQVDVLRDAIVEDVELRDIKVADVLGTLKVAELYSHLVQFATCLHKLCLNVVFKSYDNLLALFSKSIVDQSNSRLLHQFMIEAEFLKWEVGMLKPCINCRQIECRDGLSVSLDNFVGGADVTCLHASDEDDDESTVTSFYRRKVFRLVKEGDDYDIVDVFQGTVKKFDVMMKNGAKFVYKCSE